MGVQLPVRLTRTRRRWQGSASPATGAGPSVDDASVPRHDQGMVSIELAIALPLLLLFAVVGAWLLAAGQLQARLTDAARATARELARGDTRGDAVAAGRRVVPDADIVVLRDGRRIKVSARQVIRAPGPVLGRLHRTVTATIVTEREQDW